MTEILTESFCERCGTRYTFESVAPNQKRLGGIKTLGKGLRNFVLSDDSSLDEAMAAARSDAERETTTQQLDAFHRTFNFCMSCRQYTCANCWNGVEARCLSCAPMAGVVDFQAPAAEPDLERLLRLTAPPSETAWQDEHVHEPHVHEPLVEAPAAAGEDVPTPEPAWPGEPDATGLPAWARAAGIQPEAPEGAAEPIADAMAEIPYTEEEPFDAPLSSEDLAARLGGAPVAGETADLGAEAEATAPEAVAAVDEAAADEAEPVEADLAGLEPGASLDDAIAAYEASLAGEPAEETPEAAAFAAAPTASTAPEEPSLAAEPQEPLVDETAPLAAARDEVVIEEAASAPRPLIDVVEQPTWPVSPPPAGPEPEPVAAEAAAAEAPPEPEPVAAAEAAPEPFAEPEPVAAAAAAAATEALPEAIPAAPAAPPAAPAAAPQPAVPPTPAAPADAPTGAPQWPTGPRWPTSIPARQAPPPAAPAIDPLTAIMARQATEAMWAASSRDVVQPPMAATAPAAGVQPCVSCGISLSANARFCRRCGTSQVG